MIKNKKTSQQIPILRLSYIKLTMKTNKIYKIILTILTLSLLSIPLAPAVFPIITSITWAITTILIIFASLHYTKKYHAPQIHLLKIIKSLKVTATSKKNITSLEAITMTLSEKIGVGSLSGVALALYFGGPGTILYILIFTLIASVLSYAETSLAITHKSPNSHGPTSYIQKTSPRLSSLYSILLVVAYSGLFLAVQANTITKVLPISPHITSIILTISVLILIYKSLKTITSLSSYLMPLMILTYFIVALYILITNLPQIPEVFSKIISSALTPKAGLSSLIYIIIYSLQRTIFMTEVGIGTTAISASLVPEDPHKQGLSSIFTIYLTTFVVCLATALIILTSPYETLTIPNPNGIEITLFAFNYHLGTFGSIFLTITIIMFAYTTIISLSIFGELNLHYLPKKLFKIIILIITFMSCFLSPSFLWNITDLLVALLIIINITSMIKITK